MWAAREHCRRREDREGTAPRAGAAWRRRLCTLALAAAVGGAAGCGKSPGEKAHEAVTTIRSWTAAARFTLDAWGAGDVPSAYASYTLEVAAQALDKATQSLAKAAPPPAGGAPAGPLAPATEVARARAAVEHGDRAAARRQARALLAADSALSRLERSPGGTP